jgi:site-specific DNA-methyltransferase (adenine-specific)
MTGDHRKIVTGDCRLVLERHAPFDMIIADPPYGDTSLSWDTHCEGWIEVAAQLVKPTGSMWVFGSMRFLMAHGTKFNAAGWRYAQDIVWEKHNGSSFHADRFKRVHEHVVQFYREGVAWTEVFNDVQKTADATARQVRRKTRPKHTGHINGSSYISEDGGPRIVRTVISMRSMHGRAIHPTEKPVALLDLLIRSSCPVGGLVGDLFAGSGAAGEAAHFAGRDYIGSEIDTAMAAVAQRRLSQLLPFGRAAS